MEPVEYVFSVDVFTPETMPMARLAEYMAALAKLVGHAEHTHFVRLEKGSARIVHKVDAVDVPKVEQRLREVVAGGGPREARKGFETLDELLASDNAVGHFAPREGGGVIIPFPGRDRPRQIVFPSFWQDGSIDGQLVSVGGRDQTAHAILQDGATVYTGLTMRRPLAVRLAPLLYGPKLRITGRGRWERQPDGEWKLLEFKVDRHEILDQRPLGEMLAAVRAVPDNGLMDADAHEAVRDIQSDDGAIH